MSFPAIRNARYLWFGIDTLRLSFGNKYVAEIELLFRGLSTNSPDIFNAEIFGVAGFRLHFTDFGDRSFITFFYGEAMTAMFEVTKMKNQQVIQLMRYRVEFFSSMFFTSELKSMFRAMIVLWKDKARVTRIDLAVDCTLPVRAFRKELVLLTEQGDVIPNPEKTSFKSCTMIRNQTLYLGTKQGNHKYFIRIYDKKLDSAKKGKFHIFQHYISMQESVSRLEVQINNDSCKDFGITCEDVLEYVDSSEKEYFNTRCFYYYQMCTNNKRGTQIDFVAALAGGLVKKKKVRIKDKYKGLDQIQYMKTFIAYSRTIREFGYDPLVILQRDFQLLSQQEKI